MIATYTDGSEVAEGDSIRYHQAPGGLMPHGDWQYGVARKFPRSPEEVERMLAFNEREGFLALDPDELHLHNVDTQGRDRYYMIAGGHIVERWPLDVPSSER